MKSYILFSAFGDEIRHHLICQSKEDAETKLVEFASNHIIDRIGKCNFVNTLENNVPTKLCPVGYVVKYARRDTDADVDVPKLSANYINQIYIMSTRDVEVGRIFSNKKRVIEINGYYAIDELITEDSSPAPTTSSSRPNITKIFTRSDAALRVKYNSVIQEILARAKSADSILSTPGLIVKDEPVIAAEISAAPGTSEPKSE